MDERKSYGGLIIWTACYLLLMVGCCFLVDAALMMRLIMQVTSVGVTLLVYMIYVNEKVYWINGVSFEDALKATSGQRKRFALRHLKLFLWFSGPYLVYSAVSYGLQWSEWIDFTIGCVGICAVAIATVPIKLE